MCMVYWQLNNFLLRKPLEQSNKRVQLVKISVENNNYKVALNDQSIAVNTCFSTGSILFWVQQINKLRSLAIAYSPNLEKRIETANGSVMCDYMITLTSLHVSVH